MAFLLASCSVANVAVEEPANAGGFSMCIWKGSDMMSVNLPETYSVLTRVSNARRAGSLDKHVSVACVSIAGRTSLSLYYQVRQSIQR